MLSLRLSLLKLRLKLLNKKGTSQKILNKRLSLMSKISRLRRKQVVKKTYLQQKP